MLPKGAMYEDTKLPCAWGAVLPSLQLDAFVWSPRPLPAGKTLQVRPLAYCQINEDGAVSTILLTTHVDLELSRDEIRTFEALLARYLHRHFEIGGWGNEPAAKKLLELRYNINT